MSSSTSEATPPGLSPIVVQRIQDHQKEIWTWLDRLEAGRELPLYSSVDIRDAGFKIAVVDTNLFPAGFNNLCPHGRADATRLLHRAIERRAAGCRNVLVIAEEHTRNAWYLENIRVLQEIIVAAGFHVKTAAPPTVEPSWSGEARSIDLTTATGQSVRIHNLQQVLDDIDAGRERFCLIILNNDLTTGIPAVLRAARIPIYPSLMAGWHARLKSLHFAQADALIREFAGRLDLDPWLFSCLDAVIEDVDIRREEDRGRIADAAGELMGRICEKYAEHRIQAKPYVMLKADAGTYGMGVMPIEDPSEVLQLNRRGRNRLHKGKSSKVITRFLLQEGVPTVCRIDDQVSEVCLYQIDNTFVGGFYRTHTDKGQRENLNAAGMTFHRMCPHESRYGACGVHPDVNVFDIYRILARIAGLAAHREIRQLESTGSESGRERTSG